MSLVPRNNSTQHLPADAVVVSRQHCEVRGCVSGAGTQCAAHGVLPQRQSAGNWCLWVRNRFGSLRKHLVKSLDVRK